MKLLRYDNWSTGLLMEDDKGGVLDLHAALADHELKELLPSSDASWIRLIEHWERARPYLQYLQSGGAEDRFIRPLEEVRFCPPLIDRASRIFAIGGNFAQHLAQASDKTGGRSGSVNSFIEEKAQGMPPWGFIVLPDTLAAHGAEVAPPAGTQKFDYEAEVAIVLAAGGKDIPGAARKIWGYTAWNDLSIRDPRVGIAPLMDRGHFTWGLEKNFDGSHPCGPWIVVNEGDVDDLQCTLRVNGEIRQDFSTSEMIWSFADTIEHISHYITLKAGDMIASGTGAGTAIENGIDGNHWLRPGDEIEIEIEGVGVLRNRVGGW